MRQLLATIALALVGVGAGLHAQTTVDPRELILTTQLVDSDGDGKIKLTSARTPFRRNETIKLCPATAYRYVLLTASCAPVPAPTPTPTPEPTPTPTPVPAVLSALVDGESFLQSDRLALGINKDGGLATRKAAPTGFRTHLPSLLRVSLYDGVGDLFLFGRSVEGFGVRYGGQTLGNFSLSGFSQIPGANTAADRWQGKTPDGLAIDQRIVLGEVARVEVTLTNTSVVAIDDLVYFRAADFDTSASFNVTSTATTAGWSVALSDGRTVAFTSADPRAYPSIELVDPASFKPALAKLSGVLPGAAAKRGDHVNLLAFPVGTLLPGASTSFAIEMGVR